MTTRSNQRVLGLRMYHWENIGTGVLTAVVLAAILTLVGYLMETGLDSGAPGFYWPAAITFSIIGALLLIGFPVWGVISEHNRDGQPLCDNITW